MEKKIVNNLKNNTVGSYIGGDQVVNHYYGPETKKGSDDEKEAKDKTVFLSYNWHDGDIAERINRHLSGISGITVKQDIEVVGSWQSIREFMQSIRQQTFAVLIVSDCYLKSKNCMFEVLEMMKEQKYKDRIFPAVVEQKVYDPLERVEYIRYWQQECEKLEAALKGIDLASSAELAVDLKRYKNIASSMGEFLDLVSSINNPDIKKVELQIEKAIVKPDK